jgi:hypothetical protein
MSNEKTKNQDYYYRVFCMAHIIGIDDNDLDAIWENGTIVYESFLKSKFNIDTMHELECMQLFYKDYQKHQMFLSRITNFMSKDDNVRDIVIDAITNLMSIDLDGETMQHIIEMLNMEDQMLSQLGHDLIVENQSLKHRLNVILEDEKALRKIIHINNYGVIAHLNNIEIACDLNDSESLNWMNHNKKGE